MGWLDRLFKHDAPAQQQPAASPVQTAPAPMESVPIERMNLIQVDLLRRRRTLPAEASDPEREQLRDLLRLTVQGIAAGMRTTG